VVRCILSKITQFCNLISDKCSRRMRWPGAQVPISSLKGEVKKKHHSNGWSFSCFAAHFFEQDLF